MRRLSIGVVCFPSFGGSGIVATEIGLGMARRGHQVHFICTEPPRRLIAADNVTVHLVEARAYPVLPHRPYTLALTSKMVAVAQTHGLDLIHAHYAVPHATAAWMAREILGGGPRLVTTLHGTDITVLAGDPSYRAVTRHSVQASDMVTTPSDFLRDAAWRALDLTPADVPIEAIPNFVDPAVFHPAVAPPDLDAPLVVHVSNFRPVKQVPQVIEAFARIVARRPARLRLIGDGPDRLAVEALIAKHGLADRVELLGKQADLAPLLRDCALFLLPSRTESFGLAALEALASGVPVIAAAVGGLPEVIRQGETGWLVPANDVDAMASRAMEVLGDPVRHSGMRAAARADAVERFAPTPLLDRYEAVYRRVTAAR